ncbi:MAG: T9SS type A sorting domain-containing protein [Bacteroidetes bacterium]|nr:T9SS type A sorting domain-containing protein [Bacteroidota bacterium]
MKALKPLIILLTLGLHTAAQAPTHTQTKSVTTSSSTTTISVTFNTPSTAGHLVVVHITWDKQNRDISSVSDTKNTYYLVPGSTMNFGQGSNKYRSALYYAYNITVTPGPLTIKATLDGANQTFAEIYASEYASVLTTADPLDVTRTTVSSGTTISSGAVTTTQNNELIYGVSIGATDAIHVGSGFTARSVAQDNIVEDKTGTTAGSYSATFTGANDWIATVATFKPLVTLPVTLTSFAAKQLKDKKVELDWTTASESGSDHFEVDRSNDGETWSAIGQVAAAGSLAAMQQYSFVDDAPYSGLSYYRLKQVDRDGSATISKTLTIHIEEIAAPTMHVYPNPAASYLVVEGAIQTVSIFNTAGQQLLVRSVPAGERKTTIDLGTLPRGAYFVKAGERSMMFYKR